MSLSIELACCTNTHRVRTYAYVTTLHVQYSRPGVHAALPQSSRQSSCAMRRRLPRVLSVFFSTCCPSRPIRKAIDQGVSMDFRSRPHGVPPLLVWREKRAQQRNVLYTHTHTHAHACTHTRSCAKRRSPRAQRFPSCSRMLARRLRTHQSPASQYTENVARCLQDIGARIPPISNPAQCVVRPNSRAVPAMARRHEGRRFRVQTCRAWVNA